MGISGFGWLLGGGDKAPTLTPEQEEQRRRGLRQPSADAVYTGEKAITRQQYQANQAAAGAPDASGSESANTGAARTYAARTRRRMAVGNAGRVTTGAGAGGYIQASGTPRTLIGS